MATNTARKLADIVVTEAGFGADLGAEKFMNIKTRQGNFAPDAVVIVATVRALKMHGGVPKSQLKEENSQAVKNGMENLAKHIDTVLAFGVQPVIALNRFITDSAAELTVIVDWCEENGVRVALTDVWEHGGEGGLALAQEVISLLNEPNHFAPLYHVEQSVHDKITAIVQKVYGGQGIILTDRALKNLQDIEKNGWDVLPICMAKTQYSFSDNPMMLGRPEGFTITIREIIPKLGAGFLVCLTGDIMTMPGLPKTPAALGMDIDAEGNVVGLM